MKTTVPLERLLEAYAVLQTIEEFISEEKQRLLNALLLADEDTATVHQTVQQYTQYKVRYRTLCDIERTIEHARYEYAYASKEE
jgi:transposase